HIHLHSFPTRRSSDLIGGFDAARVAVQDRQRDGHSEPNLTLFVARLLARDVGCDAHGRPTFVSTELHAKPLLLELGDARADIEVDRKSTRLNSSHVKI